MGRLFGRVSAGNTTVRSALSQVNEPGVWTDVATEFLVESKARAKTAGIRVVGVNGKALKLLAAANIAVSDVLSRELVPVAIHAFQNWPIRTQPGIRKTKRGKDRLPGHSKSLLLMIWKARSSTEFSGSIVNRADYSGVIDRGEVGNRLVFEPGRKAARRAAPRIAALLKSKAEG